MARRATELLCEPTVKGEGEPAGNRESAVRQLADELAAERHTSLPRVTRRDSEGALLKRLEYKIAHDEKPQ